jgi:hypothetical protein
VDGANGVGAEKIKILAQLFSKEMALDENSNHQKKENLKIHLFNDAIDNPDQLNHLVIF